MTPTKYFHFAIVPVTVLCIMILDAPLVLTQGRFQVASRDVLSQSSLVIYTIRDSQLATCYTLFVVESPPPPAPVMTSTEPPRSDDVTQARATRDEQLAALRVRVAAQTRFDQVSHAYENEVARRKIEDAYDYAIRGVPMMSTLPGYSLIPGLQTGGYQYQAEEIRRGTVDPTTDRTIADSNQRLERWLVQAVQAPRIAATGPVPCKPNVVTATKP
jgi:hypothetical protein